MRAALPLLALAGLVVAPDAAAQTYLWALNETGQLTVNGTLLDKLPSKFDEDESPEDADLQERWASLFVKGADGYSIRLDGRVSKTGAKLYDLAFDNITEHQWIDVVVTDDDAVWALRSDGRLSRNGESVADFNLGSFLFTDLTTDGEDVYSLRSDGAVYRDNITTKLFAFEAGNFMGDGEGESDETFWDSLAIDPLDGMLHGLRRDGSVVRGDPADPGGEGDPPTGEVVAKLPFGDSATDNSIYVSIAFGADGRWWTIRGGGRVYNEDDVFDEVVDLPGDAEDDFDEVMRQIIATDTGFLALRYDGRVYDGSGEIVNLTKDRYSAMQLSTTPPDLTNLKNGKPKVAGYAPKAVTGEAFAFPVLATDTDKAADELVVTADPDSVPPGAVWDDDARTLTWDAPGPAGKYAFKVTVDDGVAKPVKKTFKINVKDPDTNDAKNRPPQPTKVKGVQVLAGVPFEMPILVRDLDGDDVTVTVDETKEPYTLGATFDPMTNTFAWDDPPLDALGKYKLVFQISDGTKTKKLSVKIKLVSSILAF